MMNENTQRKICWIRRAYRQIDNPLLDRCFAKTQNRGGGEDDDPSRETTHFLSFDTHELEYQLADKVFRAKDISQLRRQFVEEGVTEFHKELQAALQQRRRKNHGGANGNSSFIVSRYSYQVVEEQEDEKGNKDDCIAGTTSAGTSTSCAPPLNIAIRLKSAFRPQPDSGELHAAVAEASGKLAAECLRLLVLSTEVIGAIVPGKINDPATTSSGTTGTTSKTPTTHLYFDRLYDAHSVDEENYVVKNCGLLFTKEAGANAIHPIPGCHNLIADFGRFTHDVAVFDDGGTTHSSTASDKSPKLQLASIPVSFTPFARFLHRNWGKHCGADVGTVTELTSELTSWARTSTSASTAGNAHTQGLEEGAVFTQDEQPAETGSIGTGKNGGTKPKASRWRKKEKAEESAAVPPREPGQPEKRLFSPQPRPPAAAVAEAHQGTGNQPQAAVGEEEKNMFISPAIVPQKLRNNLPTVRLTVAYRNGEVKTFAIRVITIVHEEHENYEKRPAGRGDVEQEKTQRPRQAGTSAQDLLLGAPGNNTKPDAPAATTTHPHHNYTFRGGERAALARFKKVILEQPKFVRDFEKPKTNPMALPPNIATTGLSPYFANGFLSVKMVACYLYTTEPQKTTNAKDPNCPPTQQCLLGQLFWREFAHFLGFVLGKAFETMEQNPFCLQYSKWNNFDDEEEDAAGAGEIMQNASRGGTYKGRGTTSSGASILSTEAKILSLFAVVPRTTTGTTKMDQDENEKRRIQQASNAVDPLHPKAVLAGFQQLRHTGWIHHIMRHMLACYWTRGSGTMHLHWELGRDLFHSFLLDYDWAINCSQWQWLSCSFLFYSFNRVYHPAGFAKKWDRTGGYQRYWLAAGSSYSDVSQEHQPHGKVVVLDQLLDQHKKSFTAVGSSSHHDATSDSAEEQKKIQQYYKAAYLSDENNSDHNYPHQHPLFYSSMNADAVVKEWEKEDKEFGNVLKQKILAARKKLNSTTSGGPRRGTKTDGISVVTSTEQDKVKDSSSQKINRRSSCETLADDRFFIPDPNLRFEVSSFV
ncbi:unnamed protein product [Amoebophrya sp. A120]|nr:unnamed protein product [Amoebophrya sp. A120]|eukprot:GSA120T00022854001.1